MWLLLKMIKNDDWWEKTSYIGSSEVDVKASTLKVYL